MIVISFSGRGEEKWENNMLAAGVPPEDVVYASNQTSDANGIWAGVVPYTGLVWSVLPRTPGDYTHQVDISGANVTVTFKQIKGPLGLTLGTLLTATIFEASAGVVNFDLIGSRPRT
jgi:hypothetical protein